MKRRAKEPTIFAGVNEPVATKVLIPYTKTSELLQIVVDCLRLQFIQPTLIEVGDDDRYYRLLRDAWEEGEEFFTVEQDVLTWIGSIAEMEKCEQIWCSLPTVCHGRTFSTTLGCMKFSARLIEENPHIWDKIEPTWMNIDAHFAEQMGWPFILPHTHGPIAAHMNELHWPTEISTRFADEKIFWTSMEAGDGPVVVMGNKETQQWQIET